MTSNPFDSALRASASHCSHVTFSWPSTMRQTRIRASYLLSLAIGPEYADRHAGGVLRPGQDRHLQVELARTGAADVRGRPGFALDAPQERLRAAHLPSPGRGRPADGPAQG